MTQETTPSQGTAPAPPVETTTAGNGSTPSKESMLHRIEDDVRVGVDEIEHLVHDGVAKVEGFFGGGKSEVEGAVSDVDNTVVKDIEGLVNKADGAIGTLDGQSAAPTSTTAVEPTTPTTPAA